MLEAALRYAHRGWSVFPVQGKKPLVFWRDESTTEDGKIAQWWTRWPNANVALDCAKSGLLVIDADNKNNGVKHWNMLCRDLAIPTTLTAITGGGGVHSFFYQNGHNHGNTTGKLPSGIDVRGQGGYVVLPPSVHENGQHYSWKDDTDTSPLPDSLWSILRAKTDPLSDDSDMSDEDPQRIPSGARNSTLTRFAGSLRRTGMTADDIHFCLSHLNETKCSMPLPDAEVWEIARSIGRRPSLAELTRGKSTFISAKTLLTEPDEEIPWLVEDLFIRSGNSIIAAQPKVGKSVLALNLGVAVAQGRSFLGKATHQGPVLYAAHEGNKTEMRKQLRGIGLREEDPFHIMFGPPPKDAVDWLEGYMESIEPVLIIIDTMQKFLRLDTTDDYAKVIQSLSPLRDITMRYNAHLILLHHNNKKNLILGSVAIEGEVDNTILMTRHHDNTRSISTRPRYGEPMPLTQLDMDMHSFRVDISGTRRDHEVALAEDAIVEYLSGELFGSQSRYEIFQNVHGDQNVKHRALMNLVNSGEVSELGEGIKGNPKSYVVKPKAVEERTNNSTNTSNTSYTGNIRDIAMFCLCDDPKPNADKTRCLECKGEML